MALTINLLATMQAMENGANDVQHIFPEGTPEENGEILDLFLGLSDKSPVNEAEKYRQLYLPHLVYFDGTPYILHVGFIMEVYRVSASN